MSLYRSISRTLNIHIQNSLFKHFQTYSGTFSNIHHVHAYRGTISYIQAYGALIRHSELCVTLMHPCQIQNLGLEPEVSSKACQTSKMIMHI